MAKQRQKKDWEWKAEIAAIKKTIKNKKDSASPNVCPKNKNMEITKLQQEVDEWIKNIGVRYFNELTNMAMLTEEVGEVARIIARRYGEQSEKESDKTKDLGEELADVLFVTLCLANQTGTDLQEAFDRKMKVKTDRDKDRHQNNEKLK